MAEHDDRCPFLIPVVADHLWMYPLPAYCHRPEAPVRAPAREHLFDVCLGPEHTTCPGFRATVTPEAAAALNAAHGSKGELP